jgi:hypothetical protein
VLVTRQARPILVVNETESATKFVEIVDHEQVARHSPGHSA